MIELTTLANKKFYLNLNLIEQMAATPDTIITLVDGKNFIVKETPNQVIAAIVAFLRQTHQQTQEE